MTDAWRKGGGVHCSAVTRYGDRPRAGLLALGVARQVIAPGQHSQQPSARHISPSAPPTPRSGRAIDFSFAPARGGRRALAKLRLVTGRTPSVGVACTPQLPCYHYGSLMGAPCSPGLPPPQPPPRWKSSSSQISPPPQGSPEEKGEEKPAEWSTPMKLCRQGHRVAICAARWCLTYNNHLDARWL